MHLFSLRLSVYALVCNACNLCFMIFAADILPKLQTPGYSLQQHRFQLRAPDDVILFICKLLYSRKCVHVRVSLVFLIRLRSGDLSRSASCCALAAASPAPALPACNGATGYCQNGP